ncbi:MAG: hypothetical protein R3A80_12805 [Bdellovibrionota bacterium]
MSEWGEKSDFWNEWKDEFQVAGAPAQTSVPAVRPSEQEQNFESHENDAEIF